MVVHLTAGPSYRGSFIDKRVEVFEGKVRASDSRRLPGLCALELLVIASVPVSAPVSESVAGFECS